MRALRIDDAWWPRPHRGPHRHTVGARPVDAAGWLAPRPGDAELIAWRNASLDARPEQTFQALPGSEAAGRAVLRLLGAAEGAAEGAGHPLAQAGRLVAEDLCLVDTATGEPVLVAGSVAMPSGWSIDAKLGQPMLDVHGPVPDYAEQIGAASDQLIRKLAGDRIVARVNWTMQAGDALFRPGERRHDETPPAIHGPQDAAAIAHLRVEYQTLRAVTGSAVLFTIRTAMESLAALTDRPQLIADLHRSLSALPVEQREYKGLAGFAEPVLTWLETWLEARLR